MTVFYRRLFFWTFFILFLATAPLAVLYSQGYRFDQYKKIFIWSGSITVKSVPESVNIYLNGELQPSGTLDMINSSLTINGLRPGNYSLRVSAPGYADWEKTVEVHSGVSTEFWNVYLAPQNQSAQELDAEDVLRYFPSPFGKKIAVAKKNETNLEIWSLDTESNGSTRIFSEPGLNMSSDLLENAEWDSDEKTVIVPVYSDGRKDFAIVDSENAGTSDFLSKKTRLMRLDRARWSPKNDNTIYFTAEDGQVKDIHRIDLNANATEIMVSDIRTYDLSGNSIYFLKRNNILYKSDLDGKNEAQLIFSPIPFAGEGGHLRLIAYDDDRQAIISEEGELFVHNDNTDANLKKIADGATGAQFSDDGKKLLYWTENEITVLYLREWKVQPRREANEIQQIIRFSTPIRNVFWYRDYEHVFFSTQGKVKIIELDPRDRRICFDLLKYNSENFSASYDSPNGIYYFVDELDGKRKLFFLNIPEQTGFFGG